MGTNRTCPGRRLNPYPWYLCFRTRLTRAKYMWRHKSPAYRGDPKKGKAPWPEWRRRIARMFVILDVFLSQPEYYFLGHYNLNYYQCARLRRLCYWQTRLYRWATGFGLPEDD